MSWEDVFEQMAKPVLRRQELLALGATGRALTEAVRWGHLTRLRNGHYALPQLARPIRQAVRLGGRLACVSALAIAGAFSVELFPHVLVEPGASRLRSPNARIPLTELTKDGATVHWVTCWPGATPWWVTPGQACAQVAQCLPLPLAVATIDSAVALGFIGLAEARDAIRAGPAAHHRVADLIVSDSGSGPESVLRVALVRAGIPFRIQARMPRVGRVDFLVADCLIVEVDSRLAHDGWEARLRDSGRDLNAALDGYPTFRPVYQQVMFDTERVVAAIRALVASLRRSR